MVFVLFCSTANVGTWVIAGVIRVLVSGFVPVLETAKVLEATTAYRERMATMDSSYAATSFESDAMGSRPASLDSVSVDSSDDASSFSGEEDVAEDMTPTIVADEDMTPTTPTSGVNHSLELQIAAVQEEIEANESAYRQRKDLLVGDYTSRVELLNKKIKSLKQEAEWQEAHHKKEMNYLSDKWKNKLDKMIVSLETAYKLEKLERVNSDAELEERLKVCDQQIAKLLETVSKQSEQIEEAKQERELIQQEMKDVLVTLHFHSEAYNEESKKQGESLNALREDYFASIDEVNNHLSEITTYVDSVQYEVGALQEKTASSMEELNKQQVAARETMQDKVQRSLDFKFADVESQLQVHTKEIEAVVKETNQLRADQEESIKPFQEKALGRFDTIESDMKGIHNGLIEQIGSSATKLLTRVQEESIGHTVLLKSHKDDLASMIHQHSNGIKSAKEEIETVAAHCNSVKNNLATLKKETEEDKLKLTAMIMSNTEEITKTKQEVVAVSSNCDNVEESVERLKQVTEAAEADKKELMSKLQLNTVDIDSAKQAIVAVSSNCDALQKGLETVRDSCNLKLEETKAATKQNHEAFATSIKEDMDVLRSEVKTKEELWNTNLVALTSEILAETQNLTATNDELRECLNATNTKIDSSNARIGELEEKATLSADKQASLKLDMKDARENFDARKAEVDQRLKANDERVETVASDLASRFEEQDLINNDFKDKLAVFKVNMEAFSLHIGELEESIQAISESMPQTIKKMLQPVVEQQDHHTTKLQQQAERIVSIHGNMQSSDKQRVALDEKVDTLNKTWETLFQHMVSQVKEDTQSLRSIKTESEALLNEVRMSKSAVETKFEDFVTEQSTVQAELKSELQLNMLRKNSLQAKMESWSVEMEAATENMLAMRDESRAIQDAVRKAQHQISKAESWKRTMEDDIKQAKIDAAEVSKALEELNDVRSARDNTLLDIDVDKFEKYATRIRNGRVKETVAKLEENSPVSEAQALAGESREGAVAQERE